MFFLKQLPTNEILQRYAMKYPDMDVSKTDKALKILRRASLLLRELESYFAAHELSQTRFLILIVLDREPGSESLAISDLVSRLDVSKSVITNTAKTLYQDKLVKIAECKNDLRVKRICITAKGRRKLDAILPGYYQLINRQMDE